jgi:hypothetical protein
MLKRQKDRQKSFANRAERRTQECFCHRDFESANIFFGAKLSERFWQKKFWRKIERKKFGEKLTEKRRLNFRRLIAGIRSYDF